MLANDLHAKAFRAAQERYRTELLASVNGRRRTRGLRALAWPSIGGTPHDVAWTSESASLLHYRAQVRAPKPRPLLIVGSWPWRPWLLDLLPQRSVVERLLRTGRDVWLLDWGERPSGGLTEAFTRLQHAVEVMRDASGAPKVHVLGHFWGGTTALLAAAAARLDAASLVLLAAPVSFGERGLFNSWLRGSAFDAEELVGAFGEVPPFLVAAALQLVDPVRLATKFLHVGDDDLDDDAAVTFFLAVERWLGELTPLPGPMFSEWARICRKDLVTQGRVLVDGDAVSLRGLTLPILTIAAEGDLWTPLESTQALDKLAPRARHRNICVPGGQIGLCTSAYALRTLWPEVARWLDAAEAGVPTTPPIRPRSQTQTNPRRRLPRGGA